MTLIKLKKNWLIRLVILAGVLVLLFSPLGFKIKTFASRLIATSASKVKESMQVSLDTYNWELLDLEGNVFQFESQKEAVVLINFWATWCPPCVAEMPSLQNLYDDYGDKITFMFVTDDHRKKVDAFLEKRNLKLPVYYSNSPVPNMLSSKLLPTTYIINKEGKIVVAETGAADWNSDKTRELLDELLSE
ncbi:TlpA family protein disulfide reductase [Arenibacter latericius]|uniref:TlpA family protein disulfide reductase n=1 Tax=Arenibacter latericius TaxID=86104 RepID=UPI0003FB12F6|nr:TlpA family protein disulfide reductase [Arenibacter latericius]MDX1364769.1 TlpA family protein disulfide reductase [Arenibacter latericius]